MLSAMGGVSLQRTYCFNETCGLARLEYLSQLPAYLGFVVNGQRSVILSCFNALGTDVCCL